MSAIQWGSKMSSGAEGRYLLIKGEACLLKTIRASCPWKGSGKREGGWAARAGGCVPPGPTTPSITSRPQPPAQKHLRKGVKRRWLDGVVHLEEITNCLIFTAESVL